MKLSVYNSHHPLARYMW